MFKNCSLFTSSWWQFGVGVLDENSLASLKRDDMSNMMNDEGQKLTSICYKLNSKFKAQRQQQTMTKRYISRELNSYGKYFWAMEFHVSIANDYPGSKITLSYPAFLKYFMSFFLH